MKRIEGRTIYCGNGESKYTERGGPVLLIVLQTLFQVLEDSTALEKGEEGEEKRLFGREQGRMALQQKKLVQPCGLFAEGGDEKGIIAHGGETEWKTSQ